MDMHQVALRQFTVGKDYVFLIFVNQTVYPLTGLERIISTISDSQESDQKYTKG